MLHLEQLRIDYFVNLCLPQQGLKYTNVKLAINWINILYISRQIFKQKL